MREKTLGECKAITEKTKGLRIFEYNLDRFLKLDDETRNNHIRELFEKVIGELLKINRVRLSTATKVLHTLYPEVIPIIDNALQDEYRKIYVKLTDCFFVQILIDYYNNLKKDDNWQNLNIIFEKTSNKNYLPALTKIRIFDILWWSYLKSKKIRQKEHINWLTIK